MSVLVLITIVVFAMAVGGIAGRHITKLDMERKFFLLPKDTMVTEQELPKGFSTEEERRLGELSYKWLQIEAGYRKAAKYSDPGSKNEMDLAVHYQSLIEKEEQEILQKAKKEKRIRQDYVISPLKEEEDAECITLFRGKQRAEFYKNTWEETSSSLFW